MYKETILLYPDTTHVKTMLSFWNHFGSWWAYQASGVGMHWNKKTNKQIDNSNIQFKFWTSILHFSEGLSTYPLTLHLANPQKVDLFQQLLQIGFYELTFFSIFKIVLNCWHIEGKCLCTYKCKAHGMTPSYAEHLNSILSLHLGIGCGTGTLRKP